MQIYRGMDIGTAKMVPDECTAPLRLVDIVEPGVAYSAALYQADARAHVDVSLVRVACRFFAEVRGCISRLP